jgi:hypothetical protein
MSETSPERVGRRAMFWGWMALIVVGLAIMIAVPLTGG